MAHTNHTPRLAYTEEAITVLFCLIDDAYRILNPHGAHSYESIKRLSDSEVITLALPSAAEGRRVGALVLAGCREVLLPPVPGSGGTAPLLVPSTGEEAQALPGASAARGPLGDGRRSGDFARRLDAAFGFAPQAGFSELWFPCRRVGKVGHPFSVYGVKLHLLCATNRIPLSYELTAANVADISLAEELINEAALGEGAVARRLLGDLAYNSKELREALAEVGILLSTEPSERRRGVRQRIEIALSSLKRVFGLGETLASTLVGLATRIAAKICAYTYAFLVNRKLGCPQGRIKELWA
jgi:Transposase DDE domain